jgi:hypothetical protein
VSDNKTTGRRRFIRLTSAQIMELIEAGRVYYPPSTGLHICGSDDVHNAAITLGAFSMGEADARSAFERFKADFRETDTEGDVVVDLIVRDDIVDDFSMRRQMVERFARGVANATR